MNNYSLFKDNKYKKWYLELCFSRQNRKNQSGYTEKHHIIPKSMGGSNEIFNITRLTNREHFVAHLLLLKIVNSKKDLYRMGKAITLFLSCNKNHNREIRSAREYEKIKQLSKIALKGYKPSEQAMIAAHNARRGIPLSTEQKIKCSEALKRPIECKLIDPNDNIWHTTDLKTFCLENALSFNYFRSKVYKNDDTRLVRTKNKGWGIYLGIKQVVGSYSSICKNRAELGWEKRKIISQC